MAGEGDDPLSDAGLIELSRREPERFTGIFERHAPALEQYFAKRSSRSEVEDLVSETFVAAFRGRTSFDLSYPDARPWLFGIATNVLRHHRRSEGRRLARLRRIRPAGPEADLTEQLVSDHLAVGAAARVRSALDQMDERYRDVLLLVTGPELTYEEVARALDIPVGTVRSRMSRGRSQLRELLGIGGDVEGAETGAPTSTASTREGHLP